MNGCCLTAVKVATQGQHKLATFDLLNETWQRTNLQFAQPGSLVNLERPLRTDGNLGGHFVTGHIDGLGTITRWERLEKDHVLDVSAPPEVSRYLVPKGSIAVDGISLTVAAVRPNGFRIWIIPHTYEVTALRERKVGDQVNSKRTSSASTSRSLSARAPRLSSPQERAGENVAVPDYQNFHQWCVFGLAGVNLFSSSAMEVGSISCTRVCGTTFTSPRASL